MFLTRIKMRILRWAFFSVCVNVFHLQYRFVYFVLVNHWITSLTIYPPPPPFFSPDIITRTKLVTFHKSYIRTTSNPWELWTVLHSHPVMVNEAWLIRLRVLHSVSVTESSPSCLLELWRRLSPTEEYTIGHPMYFQADGPPLAADERLFVDSCYVTISSSYLSMPRFTVIENHG